ncbi:MAG: HAMP domain-containing protein [Magnetococcus sp. MYC-9]
MNSSCPARPGEPVRAAPSFRQWRLSSRLVFWSALLFLVCLACIHAMTMWGVPFSGLDGRVVQLRAGMFLQLQLIADLHKEQLESWLDDKQKDVAVIARTPWLQTLLAQPFTPLVERQIHEHLQIIDDIYPEFDHVELVDLRRKTIVSSTDSSSRSLDGDGFIECSLLTDTGYLGRVQARSEDNRPLFRIGQLIRDRAGQKMALLVAAVSPESLLRQLLDTGNRLGDSGELVLVTEEVKLINQLKHLLPDGRRPEPLSYRVAGRPAILAAQGHEGIMESLDYRGVPVVAAFRHLRLSPEWGMGLVVKVDQEELFAPLHREMVAALWADLVGLLVLLFLSLLMIRRQTRVLTWLSDTAARLAEQDLSCRTGIQGSDEVGILGRTLDQMAERIQSAMQELRQEAAQHQHTALELAQINAELRDFAYWGDKADMTGFR